MGIGGISIWQLLIILVIVILLFGTKKLKGMGTDLGSAIKGFKKAMNNEEKASDSEAADVNDAAIENEATANPDVQKAANTDSANK